MPTESKISQAEWDKHKDRLYALYITDDRRLEEVVERAKLELGFFASKAQYIRQFGKGKWDFKKNFRKEEWKAVSQEVSKRKSRDKDSEVWLKNSLVPSKRLRKEISRYGLHTHNQDESEVSLDGSSGVVVRTPQAEARPFINYMHIPWIHFLNSTESYSRSRTFRDELINADLTAQSILTLSPQGSQANAPRGLATQLRDTRSACTGVQHGSDLDSAFPNDTRREFAPLQHSTLDNPRNLHNNIQNGHDSSFPRLDDVTPSQLSPLPPNEADFSVTMVEASIRALSFLSDFSGPLTENTLEGFEKQVRTYQEDLAMGVRDLDSRTVKPGSFESLLRLMSFLVYLSSNSLLDAQNLEIEELETLKPLDQLLSWLHDSGMELLLWRLLDLKTSTAEVFGSIILRRAAKLGFIEIVRNLIDKGVDVYSVEGDSFERETALELAVAHSRIEVVRLLLQKGADLKHCGGAGYLNSILYRALDGPNRIEIMQILLQNGARVDEYYDCQRWGYSGSVLSHAVSRGDRAMTRMLLKAGANVNDIDAHPLSPLIGAVRNQDVEMVQILIDAGAEINGVKQMLLAAQYRLHWEQYLLATPIQLASQINHTKLVQMLLDAGADPCRAVQQKIWRNDDEKTVPTVLQSAVDHENAVMVEILLKAGADVNDRAGHLGPPLAIAAAKADLNLVQTLLRHGSDINAPAEHFRESATALQAAAKTGDLDVVKELLDHGADVHAGAVPIIGRTALQAAAEEGNFEMVKFLISTGADINANPGLEMGVTCLQAAVSQGHVDLALFLLDKGACVNAPAAAGSGGVTALQAALKLFHKDSDCKEADKAKDHSRFVLLETLLNAGADLNSPCSPKKSPSTLTIAVMSGRLDLVHFLLEKGLDQNPGMSYRSPLGEAVARDDINMVRYLINARIDVDALYEIESRYHGGPDLLSDDFIGTPLQVAAFKGNVEIAGFLLDAGAEIGVVHYHSRLPSYSALQWAVKGSCAKMVKYLLDRGAYPNIYCTELSPHGSSKTLLSPLEEAFRWLRDKPSNLEIIAALINAGADANPTPGYRWGMPIVSLFESTAINQAGPEVVQLLLKGGASVNWTSDGTTVLQSITRRNEVGMVKMLLNAGADVNAPARPYNGRTALQHASEQGNLEMVKLLLSHGAEVNAPAGQFGITALQGAMCKGSLKIVLTLLEAGANINDAPAADEGRTALEAAAEWGRLDIVHLLLNNDSEPDTIEARCKRAAEFAERNYHSTIARDLRQHRPRR